MISILFLLSSSSVHFSHTSISCVTQEQPFLNPCWCYVNRLLLSTWSIIVLYLPNKGQFVRLGRQTDTRTTNVKPYPATIVWREYKNDELVMRESVFRGVKPGDTNQPAQFQKTIRGMKSVHHNSSFLMFDFKIFRLSGVT